MGGGDIVKHYLVGTLQIVLVGTLHRVSDLFYPLEIHALDHLTVPDVETGDYSFGKHYNTLFLF